LFIIWWFLTLKKQKFITSNKGFKSILVVNNLDFKDITKTRKYFYIDANNAYLSIKNNKKKAIKIYLN
ncbi:hypothetical protein, partial [Mycoplasmopsis pulmonis]|uniref:hypothetical protein n=1 Tax=Mycoplasmopsis pulmonis TaxID=2107 RepID=UPI002ACD878B